MKPMIIGLTGGTHSGKQSSANVLATQGYRPVSFIDPVKNALSALLAVDRDALDVMNEADNVIPGTNVTTRYALQTMAKEWGRDLISSTLWIDMMRRRVDDLIDHGCRIVIADVRTNDEARYVRSIGGEVWAIHRHHLKRGDRDTDLPIDDDLVDSVIINNGTLSDLNQAIFNKINPKRTAIDRRMVERLRYAVNLDSEGSQGIDRLAIELISDYPIHYAAMTGRLAALLYYVNEDKPVIELTSEEVISIVTGSDCIDVVNLDNVVAMLTLTSMMIASLSDESLASVIAWCQSTLTAEAALNNHSSRILAA